MLILKYLRIWLLVSHLKSMTLSSQNGEPFAQQGLIEVLSLTQSTPLTYKDCQEGGYPKGGQYNKKIQPLSNTDVYLCNQHLLHLIYKSKIELNFYPFEYGLFQSPSS